MFNLVRRDPELQNLFTLGRDFGRLFQDSDVPATSSWLPPVDIIESEKEMKVTCEVPGLLPEDIELTITNNVLTLTGEKKAVTEDKGQTWHRVERHYGKFTRSFTLPRDVDANKIQARYDKGLLEITLPKTAGAIPHRIEIAGK